jgi:hypothetical protein
MALAAIRFSISRERRSAAHRAMFPAPNLPASITVALRSVQIDL